MISSAPPASMWMGAESQSALSRSLSTMATILLVMAVISGVGAIYAIQEIVQKRREHRDLKERLGPEYEDWLRRRRGT